MNKKKLRIFLGGYVNIPNAQNINCDNIARCLDKDKFEVHTMYSHKKPIDKADYKRLGIHLHKLIHHRYIWYWSKYFAMLFGKYDIYYLPKKELMDIHFCKKHRSKVFISSIEGVVGEQIQADDQVTKTYFNELMSAYFSISSCIKNSVKKYWGKDIPVLYLGVNLSEDKPREKMCVKNVIWIGSFIERKRPEWFVDCAKKFLNLNFIMIGDGDKREKILAKIQLEGINNLLWLGGIPNNFVYEQLQNADLLLMTSEKEGLPKVIGEAMSQGVPAIYVKEFYDVDYVKNGENGYAVLSFEEMVEKVQYLLDNPEKYQEMSECAYQTMKDYTWDKLIKKYEDYFTEQYMIMKQRTNKKYIE